MRAVVLIVYVFGIQPHIQLQQPLLFVSGIAVETGIAVFFLRKSALSGHKIISYLGNYSQRRKFLMALYIFRAPGQFGDNFVLFQPGISNLVILTPGAVQSHVAIFAAIPPGPSNPMWQSSLSHPGAVRSQETIPLNPRF